MKILPPNEQGIAEALRILTSGGVIAHATETCYGFACDISNPKAVEKLFAIKQRPLTQPVSGLFEDIEHAQEFVEWNPRAEELASEHLPGPLTMILPIKKSWLGKIFPTPTISSIPRPLPPREEGEKWFKKPLNKMIKGFARGMRKLPTDAESILWEAIRHDRLGVRFRRQYPLGGRILDFYCPELRLAIEADGSIHKEEFKLTDDIERDEHLKEDFHITTLRVSNKIVIQDLPNVLEIINKTITKHTPPPVEEGLGVEEKTEDASRTPNRTLGVRVSSYPLAETLVRLYGKPLTTTSANVHGKENPYSAEDIQNQMKDASVTPDLILDSGVLPKTPPSTVINLTDPNEKTARSGSIKL